MTTKIGTTRPNILFVMADQQRFDWHSVDGQLPVRTENLAALARGGAWFTHVVAPSPMCAPARTCLALGVEYGEGDSVRINRADLPARARALTFYRYLSENGYRVASCGKLDLNKKSHSWGPDGLHVMNGHSIFREWGFTDGFDSEGKGPASRFAHEPRGPYGVYLAERGLAELHHLDIEGRKKADGGQYAQTHPTKLPDDAYCDNWVGERALRILDEIRRSGPWFLQINFSGPHPPMDITRSMYEWYRGVSFPGPVTPGRASSEVDSRTHLAIRRNYSAMVENIDRWLGRYLDRLEQLGQLEQTVVVYSSDHGEMLGDHGCWGKCVPYQASIGVPLAMMGPGVTPGFRYTGPVTSIDLAATFVELAGGGDRFASSRSMCRLLGGDDSAGRACVRSGHGDWRLVDDGRFKLVEGYDQATASRQGREPWLVDLREDPHELRNAAPERGDDLRRLQDLLHGRGDHA